MKIKEVVLITPECDYEDNMILDFFWHTKNGYPTYECSKEDYPKILEKIKEKI